MERLEFKIFENWNVWILMCVSTKSWKLKFVCEMFGIWIFLRTKMSKLGMCEYLKLKIWKFYVKCMEFEDLKSEMSEFGCVNIESWKLKFEISLWNVWKESKILQIEMLKCLNSMCEYWKLKTKN